MPEACTLTSPMTDTTSRPLRLRELMREDLHCVFQRDPAARTHFEVLTTYPGVHAILGHRLAHRLWRGGWRYPARLLSFAVRLFTIVDIHPGAVIGRRFFIDHGACVVIGETAEVGDDVTLYHGVTLGGTSWKQGKRHPTLADGVVVGAGAKILGPIVVGSRVRVGANSVVVKDVPEDATVVGVPGRVVARRRQENGLDHRLDHHLLPDPVARSISCLVERIDQLELELAQLRGQPLNPADGDAHCRTCSAGELCCDAVEASPPQ